MSGVLHYIWLRCLQPATNRLRLAFIDNILCVQLRNWSALFALMFLVFGARIHFEAINKNVKRKCASVLQKKITSVSRCYRHSIHFITTSPTSQFDTLAHCLSWQRAINAKMNIGYTHVPAHLHTQYTVYTYTLYSGCTSYIPIHHQILHKK